MPPSSNRLLHVGLVTIAVCLFVPPVAYFCKFHDGFSDDQAVWGAFGDYLNPFLAFINVLVFAYITYLIQTHEQRQEKRRSLMARLLEARDDMVQIEKLCRSASTPSRIEAGTVSELKDCAKLFDERYFAFLPAAGVDVEAIRGHFDTIRTIGVSSKQIDTDSDTVIRLRRVEWIPRAEDRSLLSALADILSRQRTILESYLTT